MRRWIWTGASAAALCAAAGAGWALTAEEAWNDWKAAAEAYGQTLTAEGEQAGDGSYTVTGVGFAAEMEEMRVSGRVDEVTFAEQADGSVAITMSDSYPMQLAFRPAAGEAVDMTLAVSHPGLTMTARDLAEGSGFAYEAPEMTIAVEAVSAEGEAVPMEASVTLEEVSGSYDVTEGETRAIDSTFDAATLALALSASELEGGEGALTLAVDMADITSTSQGSGSALFNMADLPAMLADGFETEGTAGFGETTFAFSATGPESLQASGGMTGGGVAVAMSEDQLSYDVSYEGFEFAASGSEIPLPEVTGGIAAWTTGVDMPVRPTEAPAPFGLRLRLEGLTMGEPIWSIFDPAGALPRDPATLILDLSGQMRWLVDIFDEAAMAEAPMPADVTELGLEELRLALLGAELTGEGGVSLDLARAGQGGMPVTGGGATFTLRGGNALLDRLVQMGLLPEEQAMMTRMMTGMIAKPGDGPDTLVSEIEIGPDGTVLANGAPLPF